MDRTLRVEWMLERRKEEIVMRLKSIFYGEAIANFLIAEGTRKRFPETTTFPLMR